METPSSKSLLARGHVVLPPQKKKLKRNFHNEFDMMHKLPRVSGYRRKRLQIVFGLLLLIVGVEECGRA